MKRNTILYIGIFVGICILITTLACNITFGFFHLILVFAILMFWQVSRPPRLNTNGDQNQPMNPKFAHSGAACLIIMLACCYWALSNYINPSSNVFLNSNHHVLSVDSIKINIDKASSYRLAGSSKFDFFDNLDEDRSSFVEITEVDTFGVKLKLHGITTPIYRYNYGSDLRNDKQSLLNQGECPIIKTGREFTLINSKKERLSIKIEEIRKYKWPRLFSYPSDSTIYHYTINGETKQASVKKYIRTGLPLERILPEIEGFDLEGISLLRPNVYPIANREEIRDSLNGEYILNFSNTAIKNGSIIAVEYDEKNITNLKTKEQEIFVRYGESLVFGYGEKRTTPIIFKRSKDKGCFNLCFIDPTFRYLSSVCDGDGEDNTIYITSSLSTEKQSVDPLLPNNILLFDFFRQRGNVHNFTPSFLSFVNGKSSDSMNFNVHVKGSYNISHIKAGDKYPCCSSKVSGEEWCMSIKDFKKDTPFTASRICIFLLCLTLAAAFVLVWGETRGMYYKHSGVLTYSNVELGAYMILIIFFTIRLFLLWRLSVFPPSSAISRYEFYGIFRQESLWKLIYLGVFGFLGGIFYFKNCVIYFRESTWFKFINILEYIDKIKDSAWYKKTINKLGLTQYREDSKERSSFVDPFEVAEKERIERENTVCDSTEVKSSKKYSNVKNRFIKYIPDLRYLTFFFSSVLIGGIISHAFKSTRWCILIPVLLYFWGDMILTSRYVRSYKDDMKEPDSDFIRKSHLFPFIVTTIHLLFWCVILYFNDSGYGILFLSFGLIWTILRLREIDMFAEGHARWNLFALMVCFALLLVFYKDLISLAVRCRYLFITVCSLIGFGLTYLIEHSFLGKKHLKGQIYTSAFGALGGIAMAIFLSFFAIPDSHTEQRVRVHMSEPAEQLERLPNQESEKRFLEASLNDYILKCYYDEGANINNILKSDGYFQMLPHSKIGAMWGAQVSDISLSRFVIAEHGQWLPVALIATFLLLLCLGIQRPAHSRVAKGLFIQIPLLLFVQSLVIWMAVTRRFIFLGQDFPLISCNSKLTIVYTLLLFFLLISAIVYDSLNTTRRTIDEDNMIQRACKNNMKLFACFMAFVAMVFWARGIFDNYNGKYSMADALNNAAITFNEVTIDIPDTALQQSHMFIENNANKNKRPITSTVEDDVTETYSNGYTLNKLIDEWQNKKLGDKHWNKNIHDTKYMMQAFDNAFGTYIDSTYSASETTILAKRLYKHYINDLAIHNDYDNIMHMHRDKFTGKAVLTINSKYYDASLPSRKKQTWIGNVVEHSPYQATQKYIDTESYNARKFPGTWFVDGQDVIVAHIKNGRNKLSVISLESDAPLLMDYTAENVLTRFVRIFSSDNVMLNGGHSTNLSSLMTVNSFFARNVQVNGSQRLLYPMGDTLFWASNFASKAEREGGYRLRNHEEPLGNVPITLSMQMTRDIYNVINDNYHERAVIVADGNGYIRALVDTKSPKYRVDPNDQYRLEELRDSIYMNGGSGSQFERISFGSLALQHLVNGPGSTQKPIVYSAITSGFDLSDNQTFKGWDEMYLDTIRSFMREGNDFVFPKYTGIEFKTAWPFKSIAGDEGGAVEDVSPDEYIYKSSNYYNSLMVYIGSHNVDNFNPENLESFLRISDVKDNNSLFYKTKSSRCMTKEEYVSSWPNIHRKNTKTFVGFNMLPDYDQTKSLLQTRMNSLFGLSDGHDANRYISLYPSLTNRVKVGYVYPEASYLNASARTPKNNRDFIEISIRQTAIGQRSVWNVSPLDMAQMYSRILPGQANIELTIDPSKKKGKWTDLESNYNKNFSKTYIGLLKSLNKVYTDSKGTAYSEYKDIQSLLVNEKGEQCYWVYGKTGTIGGKRDKRSGKITRYNDRLLVSVITNQDLSKKINPESLRYYVVYTVLYNQPAPYNSIRSNILKKILKDANFVEYMNGVDSQLAKKKNIPNTRVGDI